MNFLNKEINIQRNSHLSMYIFPAKNGGITSSRRLCSVINAVYEMDSTAYNVAEGSLERFLHTTQILREVYLIIGRPQINRMALSLTVVVLCL